MVVAPTGMYSNEGEIDRYYIWSSGGSVPSERSHEEQSFPRGEIIRTNKIIV